MRKHAIGENVCEVQGSFRLTLHGFPTENFGCSKIHFAPVSHSEGQINRTGSRQLTFEHYNSDTKRAHQFKFGATVDWWLNRTPPTPRTSWHLKLSDNTSDFLLKKVDGRYSSGFRPVELSGLVDVTHVNKD